MQACHSSCDCAVTYECNVIERTTWSMSLFLLTGDPVWLWIQNFLVCDPLKLVSNMYFLRTSYLYIWIAEPPPDPPRTHTYTQKNCLCLQIYIFKWGQKWSSCIVLYAGFCKSCPVDDLKWTYLILTTCLVQNCSYILNLHHVRSVTDGTDTLLNWF